MLSNHMWVVATVLDSTMMKIFIILNSSIRQCWSKLLTFRSHSYLFPLLISTPMLFAYIMIAKHLIHASFVHKTSHHHQGKGTGHAFCQCIPWLTQIAFEVEVALTYMQCRPVQRTIQENTIDKSCSVNGTLWRCIVQ